MRSGLMCTVCCTSAVQRCVELLQEARVGWGHAPAVAHITAVGLDALVNAVVLRQVG